MVFKGYATGTGKKATMKVKDAQLLKWDDVQGNQSFGAILNQDFVDISFDTDELSQKFWDMAEKNNWNGRTQNTGLKRVERIKNLQLD